MVVDGKTVADITMLSTYEKRFRDISTVPQKFLPDPNNVPAQTNDVDMGSGTDDDAKDEEEGTAISSVNLQERQEPDTENEAYDSQGTNPAFNVLGPLTDTRGLIM